MTRLPAVFVGLALLVGAGGMDPARDARADTAASDAQQKNKDQRGAAADTAAARTLYLEGMSLERDAAREARELMEVAQHQIRIQRRVDDLRRQAAAKRAAAAALRGEATKLHQAEELRARALEDRLQANVLGARAATAEQAAAVAAERLPTIKGLLDAVKASKTSAAEIVAALEADIARVQREQQANRDAAARDTSAAKELLAAADKFEKAAAGLEAPVSPDPIVVKGFVLPALTPPPITPAPVTSSSSAVSPSPPKK